MKSVKFKPFENASANKPSRRIDAKEAKTIAQEYWSHAIHPEKTQIIDGWFADIEKQAEQGKYDTVLHYSAPRHLTKAQVKDLMWQAIGDLSLAGYKVDKNVEHPYVGYGYNTDVIIAFTLYVDWKVV